MSRVLPARCVPPAGFGYPLGGLRPPSPCRLYFVPAALLGFTLRSFLLPKGTRASSARMNPRAVFPAGYPAAEAVGRPSGPRLLGFDPFESPWQPDTWLARQLLAAPLGFALLGSASDSLAWAFTQAPPTRFAFPALTTGTPAPRSLTRLSLGPIRQSGEPSLRMEQPF